LRFTIRQIEAECKFSSAVTVDALSQAIPPDAITQVIAQEEVGEIRERRLTAALTVWLVIALHLFPTVAISGVFRKLVRGVRLLWPDPEVPLPSDSALAYRRQQLGARPLVALFKQVCRPIATPQTRGAFLFGLRLMAIDGTSEDVPDTPANAKAFGRHTSARGPAPSRNSKVCIWPSAAPTSWSMPASGPAIPANALAAFGCCARCGAACC